MSPASLCGQCDNVGEPEWGRCWAGRGRFQDAPNETGTFVTSARHRRRVRRARGVSARLVRPTYYDPILADYLTGPTGQQTARDSIGVLLALNRELTKFYRKFDV